MQFNDLQRSDLSGILSSKNFQTKTLVDGKIIYVMVRTSSAPNSAHCLIVDKVSGLQSGILTFTGLVLYPKGVGDAQLLKHGYLM